MKILHVVRQFHPCVGGIEKYVMELAMNQMEEGHQVAVLTLNRDFSDGSHLMNHENYKQLQILRIPFWGSRRYPIAPSCLGYLKGWDIIHIHCVDFFVDYIGFFKPLHRKKIILNTNGGFFHTQWALFLKRIYFHTISRLLLKGCDRIIAISQHDYNLFKKITGNIVQIGLGVSWEKFGGISKAIDKGSLLYVGRADVHKKIENLIRVVSRLEKKGVGVKLKIAGPDWGGMHSRLKGMADQLGIRNRIIFLGKISEASLIEELSKAHVFVSASEYESFGISVVEAMAAQTVCVLNDIPVFRELISANRCGFLTRFNDIEKSSRQIMKILDMNHESYLELGKRARTTAAMYSWKAVSGKVLSVYKEVLNTR